jgi:hypothetical protein
MFGPALARAGTARAALASRTALALVAALATVVLVPAPGSAQTAFGDTLTSFNAGLLTDDTGLSGVTVAEGHLWLTGWNPPAYDHRLYKLTPDGSEVVQSTSLASGYHAFYDLAHDGEFLWATDRTHLAQIDPATGQLTGEQIPADFTPYLVGGVAYDPQQDHFWVIPQRNGQLQVIHQLDRQGNVLATYPNLDTDYTTALTWDDTSPGGPFLWTFSREEIGSGSRGVMRQFSPALGAFTGVEIALVNRSEVVMDQPRGLAFTPDLAAGPATLVAVQAGALEVTDGLDWVVVYDANLEDGAPAPQISVDPTAITAEVIEDSTVTVPVLIGNQGDLALQWHAYVEGADPDATPPGEPGEVLTSLDVAAAVGEPDARVQALTYARGHLWAVGRVGFDEPRLWQITPGGELVATFPIGGVSSLGWRALATDGDHLYGTDTYTIAVWSLDQQQVTDQIFTGSNNGTALAHDRDNGHFYQAGQTGAITVLDRDGEEVRLIATPYAIAGLAWDDLSPGGPYLWAWIDRGDDAGDGSRCRAIRLDPISGQPTGVAFTGQDQGALPDVPGAATITRDLAPGRLALLGVQESADGGDGTAVVAYDLATNLPPAWLDLVGGTLGAVAPDTVGVLTVALHGTMADTTTAGVIRIGSNDPAQPLVEIPVSLAMLAAQTTTGVDGGDGAPPAVISAAGNHPNPFNPRTRIRFELREAGPVTLEILDARGRRVARLVREFPAPGEHAFLWDGRDAAGRPVASGLYVYRLEAGQAVATGKMLLAR